MTLETAFQQNWRANGWADPKRRVLVAVSTGVDSMVLLQLISRLPATQRPAITVVHVNHQLRQQSQTEEAFLRQWCADHQLPLAVATWPIAAHPTHGIEAAARAFRYQFFQKQLQQQHAAWVATAHQADEQAETILLKLIRGGQLDQLTGMAASRPLAPGQVIHPLLPFTKAQLVAYAREQQLPWYEDATNQSLVASRNRVRHEILPQLQRENPQVVQHLNGYAQQLQATLAVANRSLDQQLARIVTSHTPVTGQTDRLLAAPIAEQRLLLARLLSRTAPGTSVSETHLTACLQLLASTQHPTGTVAFGQDWVFIKTYDRFQFLQPKKFKEKSVEHFRFMVDLNQWRSVGNGWQIGCFTTAQQPTLSPHETVALTPDQLPLMVRSWQPGDRLRLATGHHQSVRRALINAKVPQDERSRQVVLVTATGDVLALLGVKWSVYPPRPHTKNYHIVWKHE
ncbi:MAG: tRNA lysidine(34) synthetase TilS [Levilactobacillus sp.]|uniref:tRNA lysidine(34) synthetase TilS n=1 Tax=Levilactobacillus sp. TaxID=2767919 RepID=UPI00258CE7D1|nr:tRNA lysidine(34) synthetase TilS [Levilactobacillus sp.]MCH4124249.1 tRNA lysidine(34) synthetase TilS [Levilactobacillus sp.]MCI1554465.1 tRNA lysidine(34) synthetase TilS [Levilactobacillus sp.]MCI1599819.1 tRNA lysidine(34) synthetase TilS [Levilactobacillus sp.]MCI1605625.1 tRNA lysidine(34) synthetase TilS [Levilactobacillus sp.]